jgi:hypothetical protein
VMANSTPTHFPHIGRVGCQPTVQAARRSPRSVAVDKIQQEIGLPPVTAARRAFSQDALHHLL